VSGLSAKENSRLDLKTSADSRQIRGGISRKFKDERLGNSSQPNAATDNAFLTIVDLSSQHIIMNSPGHTAVIPRPRREINSSIA